MSPQALALVVLAGLIHASWNIAAKHAGGDARFAAFSGLVGMVAWAPIGIWLAITELPGWGWAAWTLVAASAVVHTLYYVTLLRGYRKSDLTVVYPLARGSGPLLSSMAAIVLLGERITALGVAGIAGVIGGVFLVAGGPKLLRAAHDPVQHDRVHRGIRWGVLTGAFIAGYTVIDGYAVKRVGVSPILLDYIGNLLRVGLLMPVLLRDRPTVRTLWRAQWKHAAYVGVMSPLSYILVLYAMRTAPLSHVAPAREVSMLFAALIGGQLLGEGDRVARIAGAVLIAAGVVALGLS